MRARSMLLTAVALTVMAAGPAEAKKKKNQPPPVPVRPAPILALSSPNATTVNYFHERRQENRGDAGRNQVIRRVDRTVDHRGGLDAFLAKAKDDELSTTALKIKKDVAKAQAAA